MVLSHQLKLTGKVLTVKEYVNIIYDHVEDLGPKGRDREYGFGFFNIQSYLDANTGEKPNAPELPTKPDSPKPLPENPLRITESSEDWTGKVRNYYSWRKNKMISFIFAAAMLLDTQTYEASDLTTETIYNIEHSENVDVTPIGMFLSLIHISEPTRPY